MQKPLTDAEKAVDAIIKESIKPYANRSEVLVDYTQDDGASWRIIPKNPHAALLRIYNVGKDVINIDVDDLYWIELFGDDRKIAIFKAHLEALLGGRAVSWHDPKTLEKTRPKTILEVDTGDKKPFCWTGNILFPSRFKRRKGVIKKEYQGY